MEIKAGQIWKEVDPRFDRKIVITLAKDQDVKVRGCDDQGNFKPRSREAWANKDRFNGKRGGYAYIGEKT